MRVICMAMTAIMTAAITIVMTMITTVIVTEIGSNRSGSNVVRAK